MDGWRAPKSSAAVAPARERGLKCDAVSAYTVAYTVAPARERGLKCGLYMGEGTISGRSREGAWIEILVS